MVVCPGSVSTSLLPFVDENNCPPAFVSESVHVSPEFVDTNVSLLLATSLVPSAEPAMDNQPVNGAPVCVQTCVLAVLMKKNRLPATTAIKGKVFISIWRLFTVAVSGGKVKGIPI